MDFSEDEEFKYWEKADDIQRLKREGKFLEAKSLLLKCIDTIEIEEDDLKKPPFYYQEMSIVLRKLNEFEDASRYFIIYEETLINNYLIAKQMYLDEAPRMKKLYYPNGLPINQDTIKALQRHNRLEEAQDVSGFFIDKYLSKKQPKKELLHHQRKYDFIALDLETANEDLASICQVGLAFVKDGIITHTWGSYVDPETYFSNTWLHGIDELTVAGAPTFPKLLPELLNCIEGEIVVTHTSFDRTALTQASQKYGLPPIEFRHIDSAKMARRADGRFLHKGYGLQNLCSYYNIEYQEAHNAIWDAHMAAQVVLYLLSNYPPTLEEWEQSLKQRCSGNRSTSRFRQDGEEGGPLSGLSFVFTGALATPRKEVAALTASLGGNVRDTVNDQIDYLVVGIPSHVHWVDNAPSTKEKAARRLLENGGKIQIISEDEFNSLIDDLQ